MITRYFENKDVTEVLDKSGNDITSDFFKKNTTFFKNGDYYQIRDYIDAYVSHLRYSTEQSVTKAFLGTSKYVSFYDTMMISDKYDHRGYLTMEVGGIIIYNRNTGEITRAYDAKLVRTEYSDLPDWTFTNRNVRTSSRISSDKFTAFFTASLQSIGRYSYLPQEFDFGNHQITMSTQAGD